MIKNNTIKNLQYFKKFDPNKERNFLLVTREIVNQATKNIVHV